MPPDLTIVAPLKSQWRATQGASKGVLYEVFEHTWNNGIGLYNTETRRRHWVTISGLIRKYIRTEPEPDGTFPQSAWRQIFSTVPDYPTELPDDVVRYIADFAIKLREMPALLEKGLRTADYLTLNMPLSLCSSSLGTIRDRVEEIMVEGMDIMAVPEEEDGHPFLLDDGPPDGP